MAAFANIYVYYKYLHNYSNHTRSINFIQNLTWKKNGFETLELKKFAKNQLMRIQKNYARKNFL